MTAESVPPSTTPRKAEAAAPLTFDDETASLLEQLHRAWAARAPVSTYVAIRDAILRQREHVDTRILTLTTVARVACPRALHGEDDTDAQWHELLALAERTNTKPRRDWDDNQTKTSKANSRSRMYNESNRLRNLAIVAALWSPSLVEYYGWNTSTQVQMNMLRACALRYPCFDQDFRPRLNSVLIARHCLSLKNSRCKSLSEAPLQPHRDLDLVTLAAAVPDEAIEAQWVFSQDGRIPVDSAGTLLRDLRPAHFRMHLLCRDRYNLLISRSECDAPSLPSNSVDGFSRNLSGPSTESAQDVQYSSPYSMAGSSSESSLASTTTVATPLQPAGSDMQFNEPLTELFFDQTHAYEEFDMGAAFDLDASAVVSGAGIQTDSQVRAQLGKYLHGDLFDRACDYGQSSFDADFDFGVSTPAFPPGFETSPWTQMDLDGFMEPVMPLPSPAVIRNPNETLAQVSQEARSVPLIRELKISSPPCLVENAPTYEEFLHTRYYSLISTYTKSVLVEAKQPRAMEQHLSRAQWLSSETEWASVWTPPDSQLFAGRAQSCDEADILVIRSNELITALQQGQVFHRPIVVKEAFSDTGLHSVDIFAQSLREILPQIQRDPSSSNKGPLKDLSVDNVLGYMRRHNSADQLGYTFRSRAITRSHQPLLTLLPRFRLLDNLVEKIRGADLREPTTVGIPCWARSNTLSLKGAFTSAQLSATGSVWMRNLSGVQFWTLIPQSSMNASDWPDDGSFRNSWAPQGKQRFFILEQDDVLLIPPGLCVAHALHSPMNVLSDGGILWDSMNLVQTLDSMHWMLKRQGDQNGVWDQLPQLLVELERLVNYQLDEFIGDRSKIEFVGALREAISQLQDLGTRYAYPFQEG